VADVAAANAAATNVAAIAATTANIAAAAFLATNVAAANATTANVTAAARCRRVRYGALLLQHNGSRYLPDIFWSLYWWFSVYSLVMDFVTYRILFGLYIGGFLCIHQPSLF
jgi:hypothetical protein